MLKAIVVGLALGVIAGTGTKIYRCRVPDCQYIVRCERGGDEVTCGGGHKQTCPTPAPQPGGRKVTPR